MSGDFPRSLVPFLVNSLGPFEIGRASLQSCFIFYLLCKRTSSLCILHDTPRVAVGLYAKSNYFEHYYMLHCHKNIHWNFESIKRHYTQKDFFFYKRCVVEKVGEVMVKAIVKFY